MVHEIKGFFGVYILYCTNEARSLKGRTYIGFTVDPNRRIKQHNTGKHAGGAWKTSGRGPWDMVLITHGFPNMISALRFEWAWQNPNKSRRLKSSLPPKKRGMTVFEHKLKVLALMLRTGPWNRLPLTIRWLKQEYIREFDPDMAPPAHMAIAYGPVISNTKSKKHNKEAKECGDEEFQLRPCSLCNHFIKSKENMVSCPLPSCHAESHIVCLANHFLKNEPDELVPLEGACPTCNNQLLWGDVIRYKLGSTVDFNMDEDS